MVTVSQPNRIQPIVDRSEKHLIIGAGFVGLGMAQALQEAGIPYDQVDASDRIGGNWYHGVYETAHIISSRKITQFSHFPMPADYPDFPSAQQMRDYLNGFADRFNLHPHIELNQTVAAVRPITKNLWEVTFATGEQRIYKGILICNGHHWCKRFPRFEGEFAGEILHAKDYKRPEQLQGKRVLVIGGGNSACDIAAEAGRVGAKCVLSLRESVWFVPKSFAGVPISDWMQWWMPTWLQRFLVYGMIRFTLGRHEDYGLPKPNYRLFDKHPTLNNEVPYYIKHGRIIPKPSVRQLRGYEVEFIDGSCEEFDLIVCATGYDVSYPFLPPALQRVKGAIVNCYGGAFLEDYKGLYYMGWGQARGGVGSLISAYSSFFVRCLQLQDEINVPIGLVFKQMGQKLPQTHLSDPQQTFRQLKIANWVFPWIVQTARQVNAQYPYFSNAPIPRQASENASQDSY